MKTTYEIDIETAVACAIDEYEDKYEKIPDELRGLIADEAVVTVSDWYDMTGEIRTDYLEIVSDLVKLYGEE
jgi:hypothetical protein